MKPTFQAVSQLVSMLDRQIEVAPYGSKHMENLVVVRADAGRWIRQSDRRISSGNTMESRDSELEAVKLIRAGLSLLMSDHGSII